jgi:NAD(P)-dependent dehydrogenase (short-subunit alcohol dehydrogenase family)
MMREMLVRLLAGCLCLMAGAAPAHAAGEAAMQSTVLITGSNRGIGLEFARQYAERGWRVIATCRTPARAAELQAIAQAHPNLVIEPLDIADAQSVAALSSKLADESIDVLLNNAALLGDPDLQKLPDLDFDLFARILNVNTLGTTQVTAAFLPQVRRSEQKKIVILGSAAGSIGQVSAAPNSYLPYRASKAGLHLIAKNLGLHLAGEGIRVALINPGVVDTRGVLDVGPDDPVPKEFRDIMPLVRQGIIELQRPEDAVADMLERIDGLSDADVGRFLNADGQELPW